jgi:hypothetical protein
MEMRKEMIPMEVIIFKVIANSLKKEPQQYIHYQPDVLMYVLRINL